MPPGSLTEALRETLGLFDPGGPPLTTSETADRLDLGRRSTYERLERLLDRGAIETKKVGSNGRVWWQPKSGEGTPDERARRLDDGHGFASLVEGVDGYAIVALDRKGRVRTWNDGAREITGYDDGDVRGEHVRTLYIDEDRQAGVPEEDLAVAAAEGSTRDERWRVRADGSRFRAETTIAAFRDGGDALRGFVTVIRDATDRHERERLIRRQRDQLEAELADVYDRITDGFYGLDGDLRFTHLNDRAEGLLGLDGASAIGTDVRELLDLTDRFESALEEAVEEGNPVFVEDYYEPLDAWFENALYPSETGVSVYFRDVSERKERERRLEESRNRYQTLVEHFPNGAVTLVDRELRYVTVGGRPLREMDASVEELEGASIGEVLPPEMADVLVPRYAEALDGERSAFETQISENVYQFRILPVENDDGEVFAAMGVSQDVTDRVEHQRTLERQRERLRALDELNGVFRDVTEAVIERSTREEIEEIVCERLAESDSYRFAWIGEVDVPTRTVDLRTEAGVDGYLDGITVSVDPGDERSQGPTGRALLHREVQTTGDVRADARHDPWRDHVREYEFRSSAAVPIVHDGTLYGALNVYADRPDAFTGDERDVIGQLGEVVGHAIAAVEHKRALNSDEVAEVEFQILEAVREFDIPTPRDGEIAFDRTVPAGGNTYLAYGTVDDGMLDVLDALVEAFPSWEAVRLLGEGAPGEGTRFELRMEDPPVVSTVAALGGYVDRTIIRGDDYYMRIHLAAGANVRRLIDFVRETYPSAQLVSRQQLSRSPDVPARFPRAIDRRLTDRQRAALAAAYFAGYFEWPRDSKGEEVAASLGVAGATFHQHLRTAQRKLLQVVLEEAA